MYERKQEGRHEGPDAEPSKSTDGHGCVGRRAFVTGRSSDVVLSAFSLYVLHTFYLA